MTLLQRRFVVLVVAAVVGVFAVLPHPLDHLAEFLGAGIAIAIAVAVGARFAPRVGVGSPLLDAALLGQPFWERARRIAAQAIGLGLAVILVVVALDAVVLSPLSAPAQIAARSAPPFWTGALYALNGGLSEETVLHYGVMSLLAWLLAKVVRGPAGYWVAIVVVGLLFGVTHLPSTAAVIPLTPIVVTRVIVLNLVAGVPLGWLYWRRGLEAAMLAHGVASLALHPALPGIFG